MKNVFIILFCFSSSLARADDYLKLNWMDGNPIEVRQGTEALDRIADRIAHDRNAVVNIGTATAVGAAQGAWRSGNVGGVAIGAAWGAGGAIVKEVVRDWQNHSQPGGR